MGTFDIILLIIFFGFVGAGFYFGLVHTLGAIIGVVVGIITAGSLYSSVGPFFRFFGLKSEVANVFAFILIFIVVSRLIGWMVHMFDKGFSIIKIIPFASTANRFLGALFGFLEGALVLGTILFVASHFSISPAVNQAINDSAFAGLLITIAKIVTPLVPQAIKASQVNINMPI